jgi:hypothetical protein
MKVKAQLGVSAAAFGASLVIILGNYPDDYTKWAFGMVGIVLGYWLR